MSLIKCSGLSISYDGKRVVDDVNFDVNQNDYLCIVGENGSGKSTLMKTILGLKKAEKGTIEFGDGLVQTEIGYLPQQTQVQRDFPASVEEIVISGTLNSRGFRPFYSKKEKEMAAHAIELMKINELRKSCYHDLSGGQQQRVLLARAMCATKKIILLDEPVAGLDPYAMEDMYQAVRMLNSEYKVAVIMISHDLDAALRDATHILHLHHKVLFSGTKDAYVESNIGKMFMEGQVVAK